MLLAAGLGAGIAAIFKAPLAGAIFAIEVLYRDEDFEAEALIPAFISCTVAYCVFGLIGKYGFGTGSGFAPLFAVLPGLKFNNPAAAAAADRSGRVHGHCLAALRAMLLRSRGLFKRFASRRTSSPPSARSPPGCSALGVFRAVPYFGRRGAGTIRSTCSPSATEYSRSCSTASSITTSGAAIRCCWRVGMGKILTTSLTIGSGGSGGVFGPSMVIGGALGGAVGLVLQHMDARGRHARGRVRHPRHGRLLLRRRQSRPSAPSSWSRN